MRGFFILKDSRLFSKVSITALLLFILFLQLFPAKAGNNLVLSDSLKTKHLWLLSQTLPGSGQIINKQYWKVPVFYAGMGSMLYMAIDANKTYRSYKRDYLNLDPTSTEKEYYEEKYTKMKIKRNLYYAGAGAFYLTSVVDALLVYNKDKHSPAAATIFSTIIPGMGQVYNKKYWKVPIIYGGLSTMIFIVDWNNRGYQRFKKAVRLLGDGNDETVDEFNGARTLSELTMYENSYRRSRDIAFVGLIGIYVLNIIDANVDANLYDWDVSDDLSLRIEPTIINNNSSFESASTPAFGLSCKINF